MPAAESRGDLSSRYEVHIHTSNGTSPPASPHGRQCGLHRLVIPRSQTRFSETTRFGLSHKADL